MEQEKSNFQKTADKLSKYVCAFAYISLYPALLVFVRSWLNIYLHPIFDFYSNFIGTIFWFLSLLFIPAALWFIIAKIFKNIHPAITTIYFSIFVIWQFIVFLFMLLFCLLMINEQTTNHIVN